MWFIYMYYYTKINTGIAQFKELLLFSCYRLLVLYHNNLLLWKVQFADPTVQKTNTSSSFHCHTIKVQSENYITDVTGNYKNYITGYIFNDHDFIGTVIIFLSTRQQFKFPREKLYKVYKQLQQELLQCNERRLKASTPMQQIPCSHDNL